MYRLQSYQVQSQSYSRLWPFIPISSIWRKRVDFSQLGDVMESVRLGFDGQFWKSVLQRQSRCGRVWTTDTYSSIADLEE